jgi:hypothetical protein
MSMDAIVKRVNGRIDTVIRKSTIELFSGVVKMTPVDTGRARGNWQCTIGSPATSEIDRIDPKGSGVNKEIISTVKTGTVVYLSNNVPYIRRLEYEGHSKQAPQGMVRISLQRFGGLFASNMRESLSKIG